MQREVYDVNVHWDANKGLVKLQFRIEGGETSGGHYVEYNRATLFCDCIAFNRHKHCRHTDALKIMKNAIETTRQQVYEVLNAR